MPEQPKERPLFKSFIDVSIIGIQLVLSTFAGFAIGYLLDNKVFHTFPWLTVIFLILGIIAGFREIFRVVKKQNGFNKKGN